MKPDVKAFKYETEDFLSHFPGRHLFVTIGPDETNGLPVEYRRADPALQRANSDGCDIYFTVSEVKPGSKRTKNEYIQTRAVWLDDDGDKHGPTDPDKFPLEPNIVVQSSPGKFHYYWLTSCTDADTTEAVNRGIAETYNGDPAVWDCTRILRLPGFMHIKSGATTNFTVLREKPYSWETIVANFPPAKAPVKELEIKKSKFDFSKAFNDIVTGENIHESRRGLAMHWANTNVPKQDTLAMLNSMVLLGVDLGNIDKARAQERLDNMAGSVNDAYAKVANEHKGEVIELFDTDKEERYTKLSRPPGALAELADDVQSYQFHPSWEMALIVAQHCTSVFGGGCFRIGSKMAIRPRVILARTGRGKDIANRYFSEVHRRLMTGTTHLHMPSFRGNDGHSAKVIHGSLHDFRVRSIVIQEAGIAGRSKAGDGANMRGYLLNACAINYTAPLTVKQYVTETDNDKMKPLYSCLPVMLFESTPAPYMELLKHEDSFRSGEVGRQEIVFIDPIKTMNESPESGIDPAVLKAYRAMALHTLESKHLSGYDVKNPDMIAEVDWSAVKSKYNEYYAHTVKAYNSKAYEDNFVDDAMYSRLGERVLVTMLIQAIVDAAYGATSEMPLPVVTEEHLDWAIAYQEELVRSMYAQIDGGMMASDLDLCVERVSARRENFGSISYDNGSGVVLAERLVPISWITNVLTKNPFQPFVQLTEQVCRGDKAVAKMKVVKECIDRNILNGPHKHQGRDKWRLAE